MAVSVHVPSTETWESGRRVDAEGMREFVSKLDIPDEGKAGLLAMTPASYIGNATAQAKDILNKLKEIK